MRSGEKKTSEKQGDYKQSTNQIQTAVRKEAQKKQKRYYLRHHPSVLVGRELSRVEANLEAVGVKDGLLLRHFFAAFFFRNRHLKNETQEV